MSTQPTTPATSAVNATAAALYPHLYRLVLPVLCMWFGLLVAAANHHHVSWTHALLVSAFATALRLIFLVR